MKPDRLNALTDGVVAIAITIAVLELPVPHDAGLAGLRAVAPTLFVYALSFVNIGIYWNNHHHMMSTVKKVNAAIMWWNLALLFFLSLFPFVIRWMDEAEFGQLPVAAFGVVLVCAAISYQMQEWAILRSHGPDSTLARALGSDWKGKVSLAAYLVAIGLSFVSVIISLAIYLAVALAWFLPDRRIEQQVSSEHKQDKR